MQSETPLLKLAVPGKQPPVTAALSVLSLMLGTATCHNSSPHCGMNATSGECGPDGAHPHGPTGTSGPQRPGGTLPHGPGPGGSEGLGGPHARRRCRPCCRYRPYKPTINYCAQ